MHTHICIHNRYPIIYGPYIVVLNLASEPPHCEYLLFHGATVMERCRRLDAHSFEFGRPKGIGFLNPVSGFQTWAFARCEALAIQG